ncbi:aspartate-proton symporter, putative [Entamoeba invadens IP1]|uniref:Aspartate-proton symporter, putative n=1 Tax=Entamoeba invadens IP1 TaxID=370355 RepID=A0A0A1U8S8_ENTIV|nr:aspartate-proton symporter, putative [Entamoeba invadens IP1]ELP91325.1 aspartate-proton symporter, putative [Entamoeba invadens IP1]|eukprot:XP_004258096.1 aspartate-proton symporter, putative [Entamoeba invadens IP1]
MERNVEASIEKTNGTNEKKIGTLRLFGIMFACIVGGAYGAEPLISAAGPLVGLGVIILGSLVIMLPLCLVTAELSTTLPCEGACVTWSVDSFRPLEGFFTPFIILISISDSFIDNAVYPALFVGYLEGLVGMDAIWSYVIKIVVVFVSTVVNIIGVKTLGTVSLVISIFTTLPFCVFCVASFPSFSVDSVSRLLESLPANKVNYSVLFSVLFWLINGVDAAGNISSAAKPHSFPRALTLLSISASLSYVIPLACGVLVDPNWAQWEDGSFVTISRLFEWEWARKSIPIMMGVGGVMSSFGTLVTLHGTTSRLLFGASQIESKNKVVQKVCAILGHENKRFKTPDLAIIGMALVFGSFSLVMDFEELVGVSSTLYSIQALVVIAEFVLLRVRYPHITRPYKMFSLPVALFCLTPLTMFCCCCLVFGMMTDLTSLIVSGVLLNAILLLSLSYFLFSKSRFVSHVVISQEITTL